MTQSSIEIDLAPAPSLSLKEMKPRFLQKLLNTAGLGLVEVLVASVIAMIVIAGVGNIVLDSQKAQKSVQLGQSAGFFTNQLASLYTADCPMSAMSYVYNSAALATPVDMDFGMVDMGTGSFRLQAGTTIPNMDLKINSLRLKNLVDGGIYSTGGVNYQTHNAALYISFTKLGSTLGVKTSKEVVMGVSLVTQVAGNIVVKCSFHGSTGATSISTSDYTSLVNQAAQTSCESNGGLWNTTLTPPQCQFPNDCKYYGSYSSPGAGAGAGASFLNPLTGGYSCPAGSSPYQQGAVTSAVSCGKSCVRSVFTPIFTCMKCGSAALFGGGGLPPDPCNGTCDPATQVCVYTTGWTCSLLDSATTDGLFP